MSAVLCRGSWGKHLVIVSAWEWVAQRQKRHVLVEFACRVFFVVVVLVQRERERERENSFFQFGFTQLLHSSLGFTQLFPFLRCTVNM